jgi:hypothetical protein
MHLITISRLKPILCLQYKFTVIKSRRRRWMGHVAHMGEMTNAYKILVRKSEGKRPLGRPKH